MPTLYYALLIGAHAMLGARLQAELGRGWYALCVGMSSRSFHVSFEYNDKLIISQIVLFELYLI